ncbi:MAG TPA: TonB-dependent receptor [Steroidobacteraceae bacterium]|nr:TonB-dependent receptor [Steroidobacteraceae bacterium]
MICGVLLGAPCFADDAGPSQMDQLKRMSFEELMNVEITSVSRAPESLRDAAAAVAVVDRDTVRRSGATTLPDALRLVPGIHVGEQTASTWAVSARGFSEINSEKLLVLSDTRSIYTPLVSGVAWNAQNYLLEDLERIEVIRGPGATMWGSNAVNGVINITTRSARDTHGAYLTAGAGTFDKTWVGARYGGETGGGVDYRVYGKYFDRDETEHSSLDSDDAWQYGQVGFRTDWDGDQRDAFTVQGDAYSGDVGQLEPAVTVIGRPGPEGPLTQRLSGGNVLARWRRTYDESSDLQLRAYYDYTRRDDPTYIDTLHTFDLDFQRRFVARENHDIIWGAAYRVTYNDNRGRVLFALEPEQSTDQLFSGFIQDQISLTDAVLLTVGTKLEHNDFSGFEVQPSVRMTWLPAANQTAWAAISRAVRVPTRIERDVAIDVIDPSSNPIVRLLGNPDFESEELIAYEAGYRWQPTDRLSLDLALFYNDYGKLASLEIGEPFIDPDDGRTVIPVLNQNLTDGRTYGAELLAEWQPFDEWQLTASYSHIDMQLTPRGEDLNSGELLEGSTPHNLAGLRSFVTLRERIELDAQLRYQSRIRSMPLEVGGPGIDAYTELDLRVGWRASEHWTLSLVGQNLLHDSHPEFGPLEQRGNLERAGYVKAEWRH